MRGRTRPGLGPSGEPGQARGRGPDWRGAARGLT
jgi:hypothetical protein